MIKFCCELIIEVHFLKLINTYTHRVPIRLSNEYVKADLNSFNSFPYNMQLNI
jgi:hypothetical protein